MGAHALALGSGEGVLVDAERAGCGAMTSILIIPIVAVPSQAAPVEAKAARLRAREHL